MAFSQEELERFLPQYILGDRQERFLAALKSFPHVKPMYGRTDDPEPLQGDCWARIPLINFDTGARAEVRCIVLSNSCDSSAGNDRPVPLKLTVAPLIQFSKYEALIREAWDNQEERVQNHLRDVRAQKVSSLFFLPSCAGTAAEHLALLDDVHSIPPDYIRRSGAPSRLTTMSPAGFYLFVFKLSYHLCRMQERIDRRYDDEDRSAWVAGLDTPLN